MSMRNIFRKYHPQKWILLSLDFLAIILSAILSIWIRYSSGIFQDPTYFRIEKFLILLISFIPIVMLFRHFGLYKHRIYSNVVASIELIVKNTFIAGLFLVLLIFILRGDYMKHSRFYVITFLILLVCNLILFRVFLYRLLMTTYLNRKMISRRTLIVGTSISIRRVLARLIGSKVNFINIVGIVMDDSGERNNKIFGSIIFGTLDDLSSIIKKHGIEEIVIAHDDISYEGLLKLINKIREFGLPIIADSHHFKVVAAEGGIHEYEDINLILFPSISEPNDFVKIGKRIIDISISLILILLLLPLLSIIGIIIKLSSRGPVFYKAIVIGINEKEFTWYKLRTMKLNVDDSIHKNYMNKIISKGNIVVTKISSDVRITKIGHFLRKFSIDEFPQLYNVLTGTMSLVGPRPCLPYELEQYKDWHKERFSRKPGMTGLWQVSGRIKVSYDDMVALDIYYNYNISIWLDFQILVKTFFVLLLGKGGK
ncbi:exopolysaccharide biosynthesis polyprenyl glycosylphosphotransferase [Candidatus Marinimicrobia bacterium MT.SAG.4]|nr:exopolysaccharide biosynthesis polyprenyl glycosylphosphotransferase [Candidatus Marinimicrobia bacterium MT.SAG.4]